MSFSPPPPRADQQQNPNNFQEKLCDQNKGHGQSRRPRPPKDDRNRSNSPHWKSSGKNKGNGKPSPFEGKTRPSEIESIFDEKLNKQREEFPFPFDQSAPSPAWVRQRQRFQGGRPVRTKHTRIQDEAKLPLQIIIPVLFGSAILILLVAIIVYKYCKRRQDSTVPLVCNFTQTPEFVHSQKMHSADNLDNFAEREQHVFSFPYLHQQIEYPEKRAQCFEMYQYPKGNVGHFNSLRGVEYGQYPKFYI